MYWQWRRNTVYDVAVEYLALLLCILQVPGSTAAGYPNEYVGYSKSKYRLRISLAHPRDCHFAHVQWLPLSIENPQTPFREISVMFMFVPVR